MWATMFVKFGRVSSSVKPTNFLNFLMGSCYNGLQFQVISLSWQLLIRLRLMLEFVKLLIWKTNVLSDLWSLNTTEAGCYDVFWGKCQKFFGWRHLACCWWSTTTWAYCPPINGNFDPRLCGASSITLSSRYKNPITTVGAPSILAQDTICKSFIALHRWVNPDMHRVDCLLKSKISWFKGFLKIWQRFKQRPMIISLLADIFARPRHMSTCCKKKICNI